MNSFFIYIGYAAPLLLLFAIFARRRAQLELASAESYQEALDAGLTQPASLHPVIDPTRCIGCESCVNACPEFPAHQVLGIIGNKARLVSPTDCIGHGACKTACPTDAISLVFGSEERGVDLPSVNPDFSTNVPGVYIAGELGGMGLIKNAIEQGLQAMASISGQLQTPAGTAEDCVDVAIIGAGPAGIAATLAAMQAGLEYVTIEQNALGGTVTNFPRRKLVMTSPAELPLVGKVHFTETRKEELVGFWQQAHDQTGMRIQCHERLLGVDPGPGELITARTDKATYHARTLLLAIGRRGTPRALGVPGEEMAKVTYSMIDPAQYADQSVLVVGGGDSALEAACSIAEETNAVVTLCYRGETFSRAKRKNRERVANAEQSGRLSVWLRTNVTAIEQHEVLLEREDGVESLPNDTVIVCAGGILPTWLLEEIGIGMETKFGTA